MLNKFFTIISILIGAWLKSFSQTPPIEKIHQDSYMTDEGKSNLEQERFLSDYASGYVILSADKAVKKLVVIRYDAFKDDLYILENKQQIILDKGIIDAFGFFDASKNIERHFKFIEKDLCFAEIIYEGSKVKTYKRIKKYKESKNIGNQSSFHSNQLYYEEIKFLWIFEGEMYWGNKKKNIEKILKEKYPAKTDVIKKVLSEGDVSNTINMKKLAENLEKIL